MSNKTDQNSCMVTTHLKKMWLKETKVIKCCEQKCLHLQIQCNPSTPTDYYVQCWKIIIYHKYTLREPIVTHSCLLCHNSHRNNRTSLVTNGLTWMMEDQIMWTDFKTIWVALVYYWYTWHFIKVPNHYNIVHYILAIATLKLAYDNVI